MRANEFGVKIFTFGVGTESGAPIPIKRNGIVETYKKDLEGNVVITKRIQIFLKLYQRLVMGLIMMGMTQI